MSGGTAVERRHGDEGWFRGTWLLGWRELGVLLGAYVVLTALFSGIGWLVVEVLDDGPVGRADQRVEEWFVERRTPTWDDLSLVGSWLSETIVKVVVTAVICIVLVRLFRRWFEALVAALALILEAMVFITVTWIVGRPRPDVPRLDESPVSSSFPSGHTAAAACYVAFALVVVWHTRRRWLATLAVSVALLVAAIVGVARMYRGMHHLTDVIAGVVLGLVCVAVVVVVMRAAAARRSLDAPGVETARELGRGTERPTHEVLTPAHPGVADGARSIGDDAVGVEHERPPALRRP